VARMLLVVVAAAALILFALAIAIIVDMEPSASSQGGRYFVAVAALVVLGGLLGYGGRLVERDAPFVFGTSDQEQRYYMIGLGLFACAALVLLGVAWAFSLT
jgi:hypothetical protein